MSKKPFAITLDSKLSLNNKTGSWRNRRPVYVNRLPPCNVSCPAGSNIQAWLAKVQEGDIYGAWKVIIENNPFPAIMGRVCYHPCEFACNRNHLDGAVNINMIERYIGDKAIAEGWRFDFSHVVQTGKRVLILGAGPAGLSAAFFLRKCGHEVTIIEEKCKAGGMLRYGIPSYRLSRKVLDDEIKRIEDLGVKFIFNEKVRDLNDYVGYDAYFIACGSSVATKADIPQFGNNVYDAIDLLRKLEDDGFGSVDLGDHLVVYGGGNTAIDVARTAIRLGCKDVKIIYRRELDQMSAHRVEVEEAIQEGVKILCLKSIKSIKDGVVITEGIRFNEGTSEYEDDGKLEEVSADAVVFAIGQLVDAGFLRGFSDIEISDKGVISVDDNMMTGHRGIFAGGDVIPSKRTVTTAIGHGKKAARCIDAFLNGKRYIPCEKNEVVTFKKLNFDYYKKTKGMDRPLHVSDNFEEHGETLSDEQTLLEAKRCMSCGNCMSCDNCYGMCPDGAITKDNFGLTINYDYCKGCGICERECPCGSIKMVDEEK